MTLKEPKKIIVATDSAFYRDRLYPILDEAGYSVGFAGDKDEVKDTLKKEPEGIDLLVLDMETPGVEGFGVIAFLMKKGLLERCPVLALTETEITARLLGRVKKLGAAGLITKSFAPEHIIYSVNRLLFREKVDKRVAPRVPVSIPLDFTVGEAMHTGALLNLSATGVFLHATDELLIGTRLRLLFSLPGFNRVLNLKGVVMWSTRPSVGKTRYGGSGVMFTSVPEEDRKVMDEFISLEVERLGLDS
ncbi:MAG: hypothetical protein BMS9Abin23_0908 [Thermodesulfobacteriota bacterium]|nr:MAG: hypothetical protein BMS9Abin23_0908 [Thermodesulfobacteriota bacterium]